MTTPLRVKICCIKSVEEAHLAIKSGASDLGFVSHMPSGPGILPEEAIANILKEIPQTMGTFLLTSKTIASDIIAQHKRMPTSTIQLVDRLAEGEYSLLNAALPNTEIVQVIHVQDLDAIQSAKRLSSFVNTILLDSGRPNATVRELGGTGKVHNWEISKKICENSSIPVFLAGGLNSNNIMNAIETVRPNGVDLCSGVRTNDRMDQVKLQAFFDALSV